MKTKILALVLATLMLLSMVACTTTPTDDPAGTTPSTTPTDGPADTNPAETQPGGTEGGDPADTDPVEENPLDKIPEVNYNKDEFIIYARSGRYAEALALNETDQASTSVDRAIWQRTMNLQEQFGVIFEVKESSDIATIIASQSKSGTDPFEFAGDHGRSGWAYALNDYLYLWNDLKYVDLKQDYWAQGAVNEWSTPGGKVYLMTGDLTHWNVGSAFVMFFNKEVFSLLENELTSPYDLVREDKWYYETFEEYATTLYSNMDKDGTGDIATDSFGYASGLYRGAISIIPATGIKIIEKDENSSTGYKINVTKDRVVTAVADLAEFFINSGVCKYYPSGVDYNAMKNAFMADRIAFYDDEVNNAQTFTQNGTDFGIVPWPKYDRRTEGYYSNVNAGCDAFFIPKNTTAANAERISIIMESLAYYGQTEVISLYFDTVLTYQSTRDEDSVEMLGIVKENLIYDFHYWFNSPISDIGSAVIKDGSITSIGTLYDGMKTQVEDKLAEWAALDYVE